MEKAIDLKSKLLIAAALLVAAGLFIAALGSSIFQPVKAADESQPTKRTINVSGQGTVTVSPDIAYVTLGVVTEDKDAKTAQSDNATSMDKVVSQIKAAGVKPEDIKTVNYTIYPKYDYNQKTGVSTIVGYSVTNSVRVTVRDITKTGSIIDTASEGGTNITNSISFGLSDDQKYYNEALKNAIEVAKEKAETIAGVYGITLKEPVTINENGGYTPVYNYATFNSVKTEAAAGAPTPVQSGTMDINANVSLVYEY